MTSHAELFTALAAPFESNEIKIRTQTGKQMHYITARTVMNRLDTVLGPENWWDEYHPNENSVLCRLTVRLPDGQLLTKSDAGGYAGMADSGDDDKSGYSDAFKRAAVKFGVARYLYRDGVPSFVQHALSAQAGQADGRAIANKSHGDFGPQDGRQLLGWLKKREAEYPGVTAKLNARALKEKLPVRMLGWDRSTVERAVEFVRATIQAMDDDQEGKTPKATGKPAPAMAGTNGNGRH